MVRGILQKDMVALGKNAGSRQGYVDEGGQVYLLPSRTSRWKFWHQKIKEQGYRFEGEW